MSFSRWKFCAGSREQAISGFIATARRGFHAEFCVYGRTTAFSLQVLTEPTPSSGDFLKKSPPLHDLAMSTSEVKML